LQIMTVHAAKGLEFDTVIIPYLEKKMPSDDKVILQWLEQPLNDETMGLLLAPIHATGSDSNTIYDYIEKCKKTKSHHEMARLFYVATTRAKKRLHLVYTHPQQKSNDDHEYTISSNTFLEAIHPFIKNNTNVIGNRALETPKEESTQSPNTTELMQAHTKLLHRIKIDWVNPYSEATFIKAITTAKTLQHIDQNPRWIGLITHRIFQHIANLKVTWWHNMPDKLSYICYQLQKHGATPTTLAQNAEFILNGIERALQDTRMQWIITTEHEAHAEFALSALIARKFKNLVIDRTFIDRDNVRWIIDYKTATLNSADLEYFLQHEQQKYLQKMRQYAIAIKQLDNRPIRLGLYFPFVPAWLELTY
jgi:ATP-dependent helicase/nuclease subunit A